MTTLSERLRHANEEKRLGNLRAQKLPTPNEAFLLHLLDEARQEAAGLAKDCAVLINDHHSLCTRCTEDQACPFAAQFRIDRLVAIVEASALQTPAGKESL